MDNGSRSIKILKTLACIIVAVALYEMFPPGSINKMPHPRPMKVSARLIYPDGSPATDGSAVLEIVNNKTHKTFKRVFEPDADGTVTLDLDPRQFAGKSFVFFASSPTGITVFPAISPNTVNTITLRPFTSVRVHLIDPNGKPAPNVRICPKRFIADKSIAPWNEAIPGGWNQTTNSSGYATLSRLPQGLKLRLNVISDRYAPPQPKSDIQLSSAAITPDATVRVSLLGSISGKVLNGVTNKPVKGITVEAFVGSSAFIGNAGYGNGPFGPQPISLVTITDKNGSFRFSRLNEGVYEVHAVRGYRTVLSNWILPQPQYVSIVDGSNTSILVPVIPVIDFRIKAPVPLKPIH